MFIIAEIPKLTPDRYKQSLKNLLWNNKYKYASLPQFVTQYSISKLIRIFLYILKKIGPELVRANNLLLFNS